MCKWLHKQNKLGRVNSGTHGSKQPFISVASMPLMDYVCEVLQRKKETLNKEGGFIFTTSMCQSRENYF